MDYSDPLERATKPRNRGETWSDEQFRAARDSDLGERTIGVRRSVIATLSCLLLTALLTSGKIVEIAERQELGEARDRHVVMAKGLDQVANFLSLNRPYDLVLDIRGAGDDVGERIDDLSALVVSTTTLPPTTTLPTTTVTPDSSASSSSSSSSSSTSSTSSTTTTSTTMPSLRPVTGSEPLTVYVAGDSQAEYLGHALTTERLGWALDVEVADRISTSLARPDYFNWPAELAAVMDDRSPEAVVLFIGANDYQDMAAADGSRFVQGTPEWQAEWKARLGLMLDLVAGGDRHVFWVTQPPMRDIDLLESVTMINDLAALVVATRAHVTSIDIWDLFGGAGGYTKYITTNDGDTIAARVDDGIHLTRSGSSEVAVLIFEEMETRWEFAE
ncbi:MAG: DUF459 domain-containing protein [Acidimicrobiales bacterium]|nr:DUF459 domain-containing protein [Acidimicrobiales bacterium]